MLWIVLAIIVAGLPFGWLVYRHGWTTAVSIASAFGLAMYVALKDAIDASVAAFVALMGSF